MNDNNQDNPAEDQAIQARLEHTMNMIQAPDTLLQRLLLIPEQAANDSSFGLLRRLLPVAAVLLLAIGMGVVYQPDVHAALTNDIFGHIYLEEPYFGAGAVIPVADVNARMLPGIGEMLDAELATDALEVTFAKDCLIAQQRSMHLVVKGETGPVNLMMIPGQVVEKEIEISDQRFQGLVTPASGGTLVVVGNKHEPIAKYRDRMASSLGWEY